jgi:hypothetical protein
MAKDNTSAAGAAPIAPELGAPWRVAPGDPRFVFVTGVSQPINCHSIRRAELIAAAPDLLKALKITRMQLAANMAGKNALSNEKHLSIVDAAIAKAGGIDA